MANRIDFDSNAPSGIILLTTQSISEKGVGDVALFSISLMSGHD